MGVSIRKKGLGSPPISSIVIGGSDNREATIFFKSGKFTHQINNNYLNSRIHQYLNGIYIKIEVLDENGNLLSTREFGTTTFWVDFVNYIDLLPRLKENEVFKISHREAGKLSLVGIINTPPGQLIDEKYYSFKYNIKKSQLENITI